MPETPDTSNWSLEQWEEYLASKGMPATPSDENPRMTRVPLGDGLGNKPGIQDELEDGDNFHSAMCPLNLKPTNAGDPSGNHIDTPDERPVEDFVLESIDGQNDPGAED